MSYLKYIGKQEKISKQSYETFLKLLAPFAPFITEELWERIGNEYSIHQSLWPTLREEETTEETPSTIMIMVNNKFVAEVPGSIISDEEKLLNSLQDVPELTETIGERNIMRVVYKPGRLINVITN
jgi:leucyl-tRNA synthetase